MAGKGYEDSSGDTFIFMVIFVCVAIFFLIEHFFHHIAWAWKNIRIIQLYIFTFIPDWVPFFGKLDIKGAVDFLINTPPRDLPKETVYDFDLIYMKWFTWIPGSLIVWFGISKIVKGENVSTVFNMESLLRYIAPHYKFLSDYLVHSPEKMDLGYKRSKPESARWGMAISPEEFSKMIPPLGLEAAAKKDGTLRQQIWDGDEGFDIDLAERAFKEQLGNTYNGISNLTVAESKLYHFLLPKLIVDIREMATLTTDLVGNIVNKKSNSHIASMGKGVEELYFSLEKIIKNRLKNKKTTIASILEIKSIEKLVLDKELGPLYRKVAGEKIMARHAYSRIGLMSMLDEARNTGVVACNEFAWLKGMDRILWYCASSVGRKVSFVESAGCFAHWLIEIQIGRPLPHPEVQEAVEGLFKALKLDVILDD